MVKRSSDGNCRKRSGKFLAHHFFTSAFVLDEEPAAILGVLHPGDTRPCLFTEPLRRFERPNSVKAVAPATIDRPAIRQVYVHPCGSPLTYRGAWGDDARQANKIEVGDTGGNQRIVECREWRRSRTDPGNDTDVERRSSVRLSRNNGKSAHTSSVRSPRAQLVDTAMPLPTLCPGVRLWKADRSLHDTAGVTGAHVGQLIRAMP